MTYDVTLRSTDERSLGERQCVARCGLGGSSDAVQRGFTAKPPTVHFLTAWQRASL